MRGNRPLLLLAALAAATAFAGCGSSDHPNKPRPAAPLSLTAEIDDDKVSISPDEFGAGLAVITISNQAQEPQTLVVEGPGVTRTSALLEPQTTGELKVDFEPGEYTASAGADSKAKPDSLEVGPERESAQNDLLQP